jgi:UDPglucose 6-dehydrogenase
MKNLARRGCVKFTCRSQNGGYYRQEGAISVGEHANPKAPITVTNAKSAELIKHASNAFLAMKISFINAVANISETGGGYSTGV